MGHSAIAMHSRGVKVFPCKKFTKVPVPQGKKGEKGHFKWAREATEKILTQTVTANPYNNWAIYLGGSNLVAIDVDIKHGKPGKETLETLELQYGPLPQTYTQTTPTGGFHYVFSCPNYTGPNGEDALGPGVDIKSGEGYILLAGSRMEDMTTYTTPDISAPFAPLPEWVSAIKPQRQKAAPKTVGIPEALLDQPHNIERAAAFLAASDGAIEGNHGDATTYAVACEVRDMGLSQSEALNLMLEHYNPKCCPPWSVDDLAAKVENAYIYGQNPVGAKTPEADFLVQSDFAKVTHKNILTADKIDLQNIPKRDWVMYDRYIASFLSVIVAPGGVGKSTLSMLDAISVATKSKLTGYKMPEAAAVWLHNAEDPMDELQRRMCALCIHHGIEPKRLSNVHLSSGRQAPLILVKSGANGLIINKSAMDACIEFIKANGIRLFILDPLVRLHECSENDNVAMDKVAWCLSRIAEAAKCAVAVVHHTRKGNGEANNGNADSARGASALINAARVAHTLAPMSESEAEAMGIPPEKASWYMRLDSAKANLSPPAERADWFKKVSIKLPNGDHVGTLEVVALKERKKEIQEMQLKGEIIDLAQYLFKKMPNIGELMSLQDLRFDLIASGFDAHIFAGLESERRQREKLITLLKMGCALNGRKYEYQYRTEPKQKHWVMCIEDNVESLFK